MRKAVAAGVLAVLCTGCAYYNGLYNANRLVRRAERAASEGRDTAAIAAWRTAAGKADTVWHRYPKSRWASEALYVAGTSWIFAGDCASGLERLRSLTQLPDRRNGQKIHRLASGLCLVRQARYAQALDSLSPLAHSPEDWIASVAAQWSAHASLGLGRDSAVLHFARIADNDGLDVTLASQAVGAGNPALAADLLAQRMQRRREFALIQNPLAAIEARLGTTAVDSLLRLAMQSQARRPERAQLLVAAGEWAAASGNTAEARERFAQALRFTNDSSVVSLARVRQAWLDLRDAPTIDSAVTRLETLRTFSTDAADLAAADSAMVLIRQLARLPDSSGASLFVAAEVARDRLRAVRLATGLFLRVAETHPESTLAPRSLLAAAQVAADSGEVYRAAALRRYPQSPYVRAVAGAPFDTTVVLNDDRRLRQVWDRIVSARDAADLARQARP